MNAFKFEVVNGDIAKVVYVTSGAIKAHVPMRLRERLQQENVPTGYMEADFRDHGAVNFIVGEHVLTGNDVVYIRTQEGAVRCTFAPLVDIHTSMGEGILVNANTREPVEGSPVCDYDYQDKVFEDNLAMMVRYMRSVNA